MNNKNFDSSFVSSNKYYKDRIILLYSIFIEYLSRNNNHDYSANHPSKTIIFAKQYFHLKFLLYLHFSLSLLSSFLNHGATIYLWYIE